MSSLNRDTLSLIVSYLTNVECIGLRRICKMWLTVVNNIFDINSKWITEGFDYFDLLDAPNIKSVMGIFRNPISAFTFVVIGKLDLIDIVIPWREICRRVIINNKSGEYRYELVHSVFNTILDSLAAILTSTGFMRINIKIPDSKTLYFEYDVGKSIIKTNIQCRECLTYNIICYQEGVFDGFIESGRSGYFEPEDLIFTIILDPSLAGEDGYIPMKDIYDGNCSITRIQVRSPHLLRDSNDHIFENGRCYIDEDSNFVAMYNPHDDYSDDHRYLRIVTIEYIS